MNKTYVILGGGGSFAINTARYFCDAYPNSKVIGIGRGPLRPPPFSLNIEKEFSNYSYRAFHLVHEQDMLFDYLDEVRPDVIINYAAQGEGAVSWKHSWRFFDTNSTALAKFYETLINRSWWRRGYRHFIQIGTSELYGSVREPASEFAPIVPTSPYAASKAAFDMYLMAMRNAEPEGNQRMNIIRPSNCYCPGQLLHRVVPRAIISGLTGRKLPLHGGGSAEKSYLHVRDLARAIRLVNEHDRSVSGRIYNVGPDTPISIRHLMECCARALGIPFERLCEVAPERPGQDARYWLDCAEVKRLDWEPETTLDEGLREMVEWGKAWLSELEDWPMDYTLRA